MATSSPRAVVTRASEIPPATAARPVDFSVEMPLNALMMPSTVPNSHEGGGGTDRREAADTALQFGVYDGFGAFQRAFRGFDLFTGNLGAELMGSEFLQTGDDNLGQVALVITVGDLDRFIELAFTESAGNRRGKLPRLFASTVVGQQTIDHDTDGPGGHEEQNDDDGPGRPAHIAPHSARVKTDSLLL